jgi:hypothetical protein
MEGRKQGRPEEELFLRYDKEGDATPTVGPLRIQKHSPTSKSPPPRTDSAGNSSKPPAFSRPPPMPSFPAPPTSPPTVPPPTAPLPYPEDNGPPNFSQGRYTPLSERERERPARNATPPQPEGRRRSSNATAPAPLSPGQRARFDAHDPNRPSVGGYGGRNQDGSIQPSRLAERRGTAPKPLPDSPGPETPDKDEGLFAKPPQRQGSTEANPFPEYHQQYWPPPSANTGAGASSSSSQPLPQALSIPNPGGINRLSSTASTSTVKAQRGSPPPPETPIIPPPGGGIEARFAAAGIAGTSTLTNLQAQSAQNAAAAQRNQVYANQQPRPVISSPTPSQQQQQPQPIRRPWTPTEQPGQTPYGQPQVYQGMSEAQPGASSTPPQGPLPQAPNGAGNVSSPPPSSMRPDHPLTQTWAV